MAPSRSTGRAERRAAAASLLALLAACAAPVAAPPVPVPDPASIETTLLLIGDAGKPDPGDPVLAALRATAAAAPARTAIVFLGDNVYPRGIPADTAPERAEMERRLLEQVRAARESGAVTWFVPGNHDWAKSGADGWDAIRRQDTLITAHGAGRVALLPHGGCPGPEVRDVGPRLRVVLLDTQWWLHPGPRPLAGTGGCTPDTPQAVEDSLRGALRDAGARQVVIVGHHPLATHGVHGGRFTVGDHLFPLRALRSSLWIPLPVLGSIYPWIRGAGVSDQDIAGPGNARMRAAIERAAAPRAPLLYAAGHEHTLQVLRGAAIPTLVVSGTGYHGHVDGVGWRRDTQYASARSGFVRLDLLTDGRARLGVIELGPDSLPREAWSRWLDP